MLIDILYILLGFFLLVKGGGYLIDGAVAIAQRARLTPIVIGITVIGFGTSMPEFLVSAQAAWAGSSGIAIGNVAGSNIANIALILGVTALIRPLPSTRQMLRTDLPFMLLSMLLLLTCAATNQGTILRWQGILLFLLLVLFITWEIRHTRQATAASPSPGTTVGSDSVAASSLSAPSSASPSAATAGSDSVAATTQPSAADSQPAAPMPIWRALLYVLISLAAMVWGADLLIDGSTAIARQIGQALNIDPLILERIIGLTVIALGTSLPELFASIIAARKGQTDMAIGNIIGSITFNILCVIGLASTITPIQNAWEPFALDYTVMLVLAILLYAFLSIRHALLRIHGLLFLLAYITYILYTTTI